MSEVALLLLQVSMSTVPSPNAAEALLHPVPRSGCHPSADEITVCAKDPDTYRLPKGMSSSDATALPQAEWNLFGAKISTHVVQRTMPNGASTPAVMATIKLPF